jgi:hypothetical protein
MTISRRKFLKGVAGAALAGPVLRALPRRGARAAGEGSPARKKVALIATEVRKYSHAQHFIDRFLEGYGWQGEHHRPPMDLVALYVDQFPEGDLSRDRERRHGARIYPSIAEALTLGTSRLQVDGVVIIGEHGNYPVNEKGQKLYPRYRFFKEVVKVFEAGGRSVPVFNDKHLSTDWKECAAMQAEARRLGFPFLAGSSLPVTWRLPSLEIELGTPLEESVCVCYGGVDAYDIHGLEIAQCMSERRRGGEAGVRSVHAMRGEKVWKQIEEQETTRSLVLAALARSHSVTPPPGYSFPVLKMEALRHACAEPIGYFIEHLDGFRTTMLLMNGLVEDFTYAGKVLGADRILSCQMHLPMPPARTTLADFFNPLVNNIETMILTSKAPYPSERTLLTSGMVIFAVESLYRGEVPLLTPELKVAYAAPERSSYWRA